MSRFPDRLENGRPNLLGATYDGAGVNFAVFSAHATRMQLCLFDPKGHHEIQRYDLPAYTDEVWHGYLPEAQPGLLYGYRAHGPYEPHNGHRFNHHKLLIDPYARKLAGNLRWSDALFGYRMRSRKLDLSFDRRDSASSMPKSVVTADAFDWSGDVRPRTPWSETVIYEAHPRGLTKLFQDIAPGERGTFAGLAHPRVIAHLQRLGVTAVELLPVHAYLQDRILLDKGLTNYWGYNTLNFFTPEQRYLSNGVQDELRFAVRRLHAAGIEVILDVVYNHTAEGSEAGPTLSWRGLDNASYYTLSSADRRYTVNDTGTGNTLNLSCPRVMQMVVDSLRYWATSYGIDGFRFDLGVVLGRTPRGFEQEAPFFSALRQDPTLQELKLISEPWDIGPGGYQLGNHPPGFAEWNDKYRDCVRRYWRGDDGLRGELAARLAGSTDLFGRRGRRPWASVNFITSHDGFTLNDLVSYDHRHNEDNGEGGQDGHSDNHSRNWGAEGPTKDTEIQSIRDRVRRSMLVTQFASLGTPMLLAGDEFGHTQNGNNNAYCQDNETSWLNWTKAETAEGQALIEFISRLASLRRQYPILRSDTFLYGNEELAPDVRDIDWYDERGHHLSPEDWQNPVGRALMMRRARRRDDGSLEVINLLVNASLQPIWFEFAAPSVMRKLLIDSAHPQAGQKDVRNRYRVEGKAAALFCWANS